MVNKVVVTNLGPTVTGTDQARPLILKNEVVVNDRIGVNHCNPIHIFKYSVIHDPTRFTFVHEYALAF